MDKSLVEVTDVVQYPVSRLRCLGGAVFGALWVLFSTLIVSGQLPLEVAGIELPSALDLAVRIVGGGGMLFFGVMFILVFGRSLLSAGPVLAIGPDGVKLPGWQDSVRWENISGVQVDKRGSIRLLLAAPEPFMLESKLWRLSRWIGRWSRRFERPEVIVSTALLAAGRDEVLAEIRHRVDHVQTRTGEPIKVSGWVSDPSVDRFVSRLGLVGGVYYILVAGVVLFFFGRDIILRPPQPLFAAAGLLVGGTVLAMGLWMFRVGRRGVSERSQVWLRRLVAGGVAGVLGAALDALGAVLQPTAFVVAVAVFFLTEWLIERRIGRKVPSQVEPRAAEQLGDG